MYEIFIVEDKKLIPIKASLEDASIKVDKPFLSDRCINYKTTIDGNVVFFKEDYDILLQRIKNIGESEIVIMFNDGNQNTQEFNCVLDMTEISINEAYKLITIPLIRNNIDETEALIDELNEDRFIDVTQFKESYRPPKEMFNTDDNVHFLSENNFISQENMGVLITNIANALVIVGENLVNSVEFKLKESINNIKIGFSRWVDSGSNDITLVDSTTGGRGISIRFNKSIDFLGDDDKSNVIKIKGIDLLKAYCDHYNAFWFYDTDTKIITVKWLGDILNESVLNDNIIVVDNIRNDYEISQESKNSNLQFTMAETEALSGRTNGSSGGLTYNTFYQARSQNEFVAKYRNKSTSTNNLNIRNYVSFYTSTPNTSNNNDRDLRSTISDKYVFLPYTERIVTPAGSELILKESILTEFDFEGAGIHTIENEMNYNFNRYEEFFLPIKTNPIVTYNKANGIDEYVPNIINDATDAPVAAFYFATNDVFTKHIRYSEIDFNVPIIRFSNGIPLNQIHIMEMNIPLNQSHNSINGRYVTDPLIF